MKLVEIELLTDNLEETKKFYSEVIGFPIIYQSSTKISFLVGSSTLTFIRSDHITSYYHFAFNIPQNKINEAIDWATKRVSLLINTENEIVTKFKNWKAESIYFFDNNKNIVELIARFDLNNSSTYPFNIFSMQSISEIGIGTDDPIALSEELIFNYGLDYFSKGPKRDDFVALGDDHGLLLLSRTNRNWYPTKISATKQSTKIRFTVDSISKEILINQKMQ